MEKNIERKKKKKQQKKQQKKQHKKSVAKADQNFPLLVQQSIDEQEHAINTCKKHVLIDWINRAIDACEIFNEKAEKLEKLYKKFEINHSNIEEILRYLSFDINDDGDPEKYANKTMDIDEIIGMNDADEYIYVYLVKIKNTIDGKLYLLVGTTNNRDSETKFKADPLVEFLEELKFVRLKKWQAFRLESFLLENYKPTASLDPYSRFDGDENVIEMRFWKEVSKSIDSIEKNADAIDSWLGRIGKKEHFKNLQIKYSEYALDKDYWYRYSDKYPTHDFIDLTHMSYSDIGYLCKLHHVYSSQLDNYYEAEKHLNTTLDKINNDFEKWKTINISMVNKHVKYEKMNPDISKRILHLKSSDFYLFGYQNPLAVNFKNTKHIVPIGYPWHAHGIGHILAMSKAYIDQ